MSYFLVHDLGTSGNKATLFTEEGEIAGSEVVPFATNYFDGVCAEQNAEDWWEAVGKASRNLLSRIDPKRIAAVSFSGQMQCCLCVDEKGNPLRPAIIWSDQRSSAETDLLAGRLSPERVYSITGHRASPVYSIEKLMWLKNHEPDIYAAAYKMINAKDYIILKLTGNFLTDRSDASGTNGFDIRAGVWSGEILEAGEIDGSLMPEVLASTEVAGTVTADAADFTGIPRGTPVVCGGGDGPCATVGAGSIREGQSYICMGTSAWIASTASEPVLTENMDLANFIHLERDKYMPCGSTSSCGSAFNWAVDRIGSSDHEERDYDAIEKLICQVPAGSNGLLFLPYLSGERAPVWNPHARGAYIGLSMSHGDPEMYRAAMEGITLNLERIFRLFSGALSVDYLHLIGGSENETWNQMMADMFGVPVRKIGNSRHATSIGAAVAAGVGIGVYSGFDAVERFITVTDTYTPDANRGAVYDKLKPLFRSAYERLEDLFEDLTRMGYHDMDDLAGTWVVDKDTEAVLEEFDSIDEEFWK